MSFRIITLLIWFLSGSPRQDGIDKLLEQANKYNFDRLIDEMGPWEVLRVAAYIVDELAKHDLVARFDIEEIISRPTKWREFWVPALNGNLHDQDDTAEQTDCSEWAWYCGKHFREFLPYYVLELVCGESDCSPTHYDDPERVFPRS